MAMPYIESQFSDRELKKGSAELLILSLVEARPRHGYEISKLIESAQAAPCASMSLRFTRCFTAWKSAAGCKDDGWRKRASVAGAITVLPARGERSSPRNGMAGSGLSRPIMRITEVEHAEERVKPAAGAPLSVSRWAEGSTSRHRQWPVFEICEPKFVI